MSYALPTISRLSLTLVLSITSYAAVAQSFDAVRLVAAPPGKDGGYVGAVVLAGTQYQGSDERRTQVLPAIEYQWTNGWFAGASNGLGYNFSEDDGLQYGLRVTADFGRRERRSAALRGLGNVDAKPEFGGFFNYKVTPEFSLTSSLRYGAGDGGKGLVIDLGAAYSARIAKQLRFGAGASATIASSDYLQSFFGVTSEQSTRSAYPIYRTEGGVRSFRVSTSLTYLISPRISAIAGVSATTLLGDAADSPFVRKKTNVTGLFIAAYAF